MTKERLKSLLAEYGPTAVATYFGLFILVLLGFAVAFAFGFRGAGWQEEASLGSFGVLGAAYVATKAIQPFRILATIALTPKVARVVARLRPAAREQ